MDCDLDPQANRGLEFLGRCSPLQDQQWSVDPRLAQIQGLPNPRHRQPVGRMQGKGRRHHPVTIGVGLDDRPDPALRGLSADDPQIV
jgi:hypothetical protein